MVDVLKLTVLSHPVTVKFCESEDMNDMFGQTIRADLAIRINKDQSDSMIISTLFHELVHIGETILGHSFTEEQVDAVAATFYSVLKDNPEMREMFNPPQEEPADE